MGGKRYHTHYTSELLNLCLTFRNAAKAKSRDKTGRIQRDFFGRRRLNILSKGLGVLPRSEEGTARGPNTFATRTSIALGHAKKATTAGADELTPQSISASTTSASSVSRKRKRGHEPVTQPHSSSPNSKGSIETTTSSIRSTKSRLLQQLDLLERELPMSWEWNFHTRICN